jgi:hypothetical protein
MVTVSSAFISARLASTRRRTLFSRASWAVVFGLFCLAALWIAAAGVFMADDFDAAVLPPGLFAAAFLDAALPAAFVFFAADLFAPEDFDFAEPVFVPVRDVVARGCPIRCVRPNWPPCQ